MEMFGQRYEHRSGGNEGNGTNGLHLSRPLSKYKRDDQTLGSEVATLYSETEVIEEGGRAESKQLGEQARGGPREEGNSPKTRSCSFPPLPRSCSLGPPPPPPLLPPRCRYWIMSRTTRTWKPRGKASRAFPSLSKGSFV